jgi:bifunctional aspartokinase / homoserine dehydrogenase 1
MHFIQLQGNLISEASRLLQAASHLRENSNEKRILVLVSGNSESAQQLRSIASGAVDQVVDFSAALVNMESFYLELTRNVVPIVHQSATLSFIRKKFNDIDDLCRGIQLLGECPAKTLELIISFPAAIMAELFHAACKGLGMETTTFPEVDGDWKFAVLADTTPQLNPSFNRFAEEKSSISCWVDALPFYTADPGQVANANSISFLSHEEAMEFARHTHNIIHPHIIAWALNRAIEIQICTLDGKECRIVRQDNIPERGMITGITAAEGYALVSIEGSGMIGVPGFAKSVFAAMHKSNININLISQGASEHAICLAVASEQGAQAVNVLAENFSNEIREGILQPIQFHPHAAIIELIGENMRNHPGISGKMFGALGNNGINILAIAQGSNERNISAVIMDADRSKALHVLHEAFFEHANKEVNIFIFGTGNVGSKLLEQINRQHAALEARQHIRPVVAGISNSRKMIVDANGIDTARWEELLEGSMQADVDTFIDMMGKLNLRNSVLVDVTANKNIPDSYARVLKKSMSVVACNKIAASDRYEKYRELKQLAIAYNCRFLFETNVGAALPVIGTLNDLMRSGDRIHRIEAVLSGTLNFVFNNYDGTKPFAAVVQDAQDEGYTEPDPRLDLSGTDVMRKIMILAREAGEILEMEDITCNGFLPEACMEGTVGDFYASMEEYEPHFRSLLDNAMQDNAKLKFVAEFANGKASAGLKHIHAESDMYHLYGKDNIVLFYTERYPQQPLVVKGAGAGAAVTASGVFADILRTINR